MPFEWDLLFRRASGRHWLRRPQRPIRRETLKLEELEGRLVPTLLGQQLFPLDNPWNQDISNAPVASNSAAIIAHIGVSTRITPNWTSDDPASPSPLYGKPYNVVHGNSTAKVNVIIDNYPGESDLAQAPNIGQAPIPTGAVIEGDFQNGPNPNGAGYNPNQRGDSHLIVWDEDNNIAYELFGVSRPSDPNLFPNSANIELPHTDGLWHAAQETVWNMNTNTFRTLGETSADAAGLSILAGLARPDEGLPLAQGGQGVINHALGVALPSGDLNPQYIYPASHILPTTQGADNLALGSRLRLANTPTIDTMINNMPPQSQIIARAMQQYGLIVTDIGSTMYVTGASASVDANNNINLTWDLTDIFAANGLEALTVADFQIVDLTPIVTGLSATSGAPGSSVTITGQNFSGAAGDISVFFGSTPAASVQVLSDTQISAVVPTGSGTTDVRVQSGTSEADTLSSNPNANVNKPIFGYGTSATTPADMFTFTLASPSFTALGTPTISYGTASTMISGHLQSNALQLVPAGETVQVTLNGVAQHAGLDASDSFSTTFDTSTLAVAGSPYTVNFAYAGDASFQSAGASSTLIVNPASPTVAVTDGGVYDGNPHNAVGSAVGVDGKTQVLGSFNYTYYAGDGVTQLPGAPTSAGNYYAVAAFTSADNNYSNATSPKTGFTISEAATAISSTAGGTLVLGTGVKLTDSATLSGGINATGSITFTLYGPGNTILDSETVPVSGNGMYSAPNGYLPTAVGAYQWVAAYGGDNNNQPASSTKGNSPELVVDHGVTIVGGTLFIVGGPTSNDQIRIYPIGTSPTGSTGIRVNAWLNGTAVVNSYNQSFTNIVIFAFAGKDLIQFASSLTINAMISAGNGSDIVLLGNGNSTLTLGNGNDFVQAGNGNNVMNLGQGNDAVLLGNGNNTLLLGNGNDVVQVGNGNNVVQTGNGWDLIRAGDGNNLIAAGLGRHIVLAGNGHNILIDGNVQLTQNNDSLAQVVSDWVNGAAPAGIRARLLVTYNAAYANILLAGAGLDWFWATYPKDILNRKPTDLLN
jgi:hypothetical protein